METPLPCPNSNYSTSRNSAAYRDALLKLGLPSLRAKRPYLAAPGVDFAAWHLLAGDFTPALSYQSEDIDASGSPRCTLSQHGMPCQYISFHPSHQRLGFNLGSLPHVVVES